MTHHRYNPRTQRWMEISESETRHVSLHFLLAFVVGGLIWGAVLGAMFRYLPGILARLMR